MKGYSQLTLPQRYEISALDKAGHGPSAIAAVVGVHRTTISRELKRNKSPNGYFPQAADRRAQQRRQDRCRPLKWTGRCRQLVEGKLRHQCGVRSRSPTGWDAAKGSRFPTSAFTNISVRIKRLAAPSTHSCASAFVPNEPPPRGPTKALFPTGFLSMSVLPSSKRSSASVIGKSI